MPAIVANELQDMQLRSAHVTDEVSDAPDHTLCHYYILHRAHITYAIIRHHMFDIIYRFRRDYNIEITDFLYMFCSCFLFAVSGEHPSDDRTLRRGT